MPASPRRSARRARGSDVYAKPALTHEQLVERMRSRGLAVPDQDRALRYLRQIGYYRLSPYMIPFQQGIFVRKEIPAHFQRSPQRAWPPRGQSHQPTRVNSSLATNPLDDLRHPSQPDSLADLRHPSQPDSLADTIAHRHHLRNSPH